MAAADQQYIELKNLAFVSQTEGVIRTDTVKVELPTPCEQPNAKGALRSFSSLEEFRATAKAAGEKYRNAALTG